MNKNVINQVETAMQDQAFVNELCRAETAEAAQAVFASRDIDFTLDEVKEIGSALNAMNATDELSADHLDSVSGGGALATAAAVAKIIVCGVKVVNFIGKRCGWWS